VNSGGRDRRGVISVTPSRNKKLGWGFNTTTQVAALYSHHDRNKRERITAFGGEKGGGGGELRKCPPEAHFEKSIISLITPREKNTPGFSKKKEDNENVGMQPLGGDFVKAAKLEGKAPPRPDQEKRGERKKRIGDRSNQKQVEKGEL